MSKILEDFHKEWDAQRNELVKFGKKYLSNHTPYKLKETNEKDYQFFYGGRNIFSNMDYIQLEWRKHTPTVEVHGYVGMHKEICKYCNTKEEIKEAIDILIDYALARKIHKCSEPNPIEAFNDEINLE